MPAGEPNFNYQDKLVLLPRRPGSLFVFWEFSQSREQMFSSASLGPQVEIRLNRESDGAQVCAERVSSQKRSLYIEFEPLAGSYRAAFYVLRNGIWENIMESNPVSLPGVSEDVNNRCCASIEFHRGKAG